MIGGIDVRLRTFAGDSSMMAAVSVIRQSWRSAVFEDAMTGDRYESYEAIPFGEIEELFVYRDMESADAWDAEGAVPHLYNSMVHLIQNDATLTVVMDERDAFMNGMLSAIQEALESPFFAMQPELEAVP